VELWVSRSNSSNSLFLAFVFGGTSYKIQFANNMDLAKNTNNLDFKALLFVFGLVISQGEGLFIKCFILKEEIVS
jgi:hypothetical protein